MNVLNMNKYNLNNPIETTVENSLVEGTYFQMKVTNINYFDYSLKIDWQRCSVRELDEILNILYNCSSMCIADIIELGDETISRINNIGYDILNPGYKHFTVFVHKTYNILKRLNIIDKSNIIKEKYNFYLKKPIPNLPSPETPKTNETPPRIMKCIKKRFS